MQNNGFSVKIQKNERKKKMIYLDNASTTKCKESSAEIIKNALVEDFFNPSAKYLEAFNEFKKLEDMRAELLSLVNASPANYSVVFTGSATEANNLVLNSSMNKHNLNLISAGEHASIYETAKNLKQNGYDILLVKLTNTGELDIADLKAKLTNKVAFVSIMLVSNETGAINDIEKITKLVKTANPKALVHVDAVQGFCKVKINVAKWGIDYLTLSSHKVEGPKGVGALVYKKTAKLVPHVLGGGQENGKRSGTENLPSILGFINSAKELIADIDENYKTVKDFKLNLIKSIESYAKQADVEYLINGNPETGSPYVLSISFLGVKAEVLLHTLEKLGILIGTGSACNSHHSGNRVLSEMGRTQSEIEGNIRLSFLAETTTQITPDNLAKIIVTEASKLKNTSSERK